VRFDHHVGANTVLIERDYEVPCTLADEMATFAERLLCVSLIAAGCSTSNASGETEPAATTSGSTSGMSVDDSGTATSTTNASTGGEDDSGSDEPTGTVDPPPEPSCDGVGPATDALGVTPHDLSLPYPTLEHLSVTWTVDGDENENATATVRYRAEGGPWREGTPLQRVPAGENTNAGFTWDNTLSGSLFGLQPGTTYEVEVFLSDPDGGCAIETMEATTRIEPQAPDGAPVTAVSPGGLQAALDAASPGDILELADGTYAGATVGVDGMPDAPIVLRASGSATLEGDLRIDGRQHIMVEGLTVRGQIKFNGASNLTIRGCTVEAEADGIVTQTRSENLFIADNTVRGSTSWTENALGVDGDNIGEGILVNGPGHVIQNNFVTGFRDGISFVEGEGQAVDQRSIDVLYNDIYDCADDGIEADFCMGNCRIVGNRLTNTFIALSSQPGLGGPTYFVRNALYNVILSAFKLQRSSVGDVLWHNTVVKNGDAFGVYTTDVFSHLHTRNNLFIGGPGGEYGGWSSGQGDVLSLGALDVGSSDLNYDGFGSTNGMFAGNVGDATFDSLEALRSMTTETDAVEVTLDVFAGPVDYPSDPFPAAAGQDLRIDEAGAAVDVGTVIPGINDDHAGAGPDLGAYEAGEALPAYGPR